MSTEAIKENKRKRRPREGSSSSPKEPTSAASTQPDAAHWARSPWAAGVALFAITVLVYLPAMLWGGFVWDDDLHVTNNLITKPGALYRNWFTADQPNYWPITWSAFWLEWKLFGMDPTGYHVVNVLVHAANALLAWRVLRRLAVPGAWIAGLVFALHPVNVETAAWITQLKTLLSVFFFLGSLLLYLRSESETAGRRYASYGASVALFLIGMLAKPAIVTMPVVLLGMAWWQRGRIGRGDLLRSLPFFAVAGALSVTEIWFQYTQSIAGAEVRTDSLIARTAGAGWVAGFYLKKTLLPWNLMPIYPRWSINPASIAAWLPNAAFLAAAAAAWICRRGWGRPVMAGLGYFLLTLAPVLGFLNIYYMRFSYVADHYQYVSILGVTALVVGAGTWGARRLGAGARPGVAAAAGVVLALFAAQTVALQRDYRNVETFYRHALERNPNAYLARNNLGHLLLNRRDLDGAWEQFTHAKRIQPEYAEAWANLGSVMAARGRVDEAMPYFRKASELSGDIFELHNRLGETYLKMNRMDEAAAEFELAIALEPKCAAAHDGLGQIAMRRRLFPLAEEHFGQAMAVAPKFALAYEHLAGARLAAGNAEGAFAAYREAIEAMPDSPELRNNLAATLSQTGRVDEAIAELKKAVPVRPDFAPTYKNLGALLAGKGEIEAAKEALRDAVRLAPADQESLGLLRHLEGAGGGPPGR